MINYSQNSKLSLLSLSWFLIFFIIYIKSVILLMSLYSYDIKIILTYSIFSIMPIMFLISFSFILYDKKNLIYLLIINVITSILFTIDLIYARAFGKLIDLNMIISANNLLSGLAPSILSIIQWTDLILFIDIPFLVLLISKIDHVKIKRKFFFFIITSVASILMMGIHFVNLEKSKILGNYQLHPLYMSPLGNHIFDLYRIFYERNDELNYEEIALIEKWFAENSKYESPDIQYSNLMGIAKGNNVIAVQFESLENFVINNLLYNQEITPNINRILKNSIYFNNIFDQVRDGKSSDAELMFNTSLYPISNGSTFIRFANNKYLSLPKILKTYGYKSVAIHGDDKEFWNREQVFSSFEFDKYIDEDKFEFTKIDGMGIADESLFMQSFKELNKFNDPFYLFIITLTSHMPFDISEDIRYLELPYDNFSCNYLQSIHYTDKAFGEFYNKLELNGYLNNSILVIYGDHEGIHKNYDTYLPENNGKIPFIIHIPGMDGFTMKKTGGQVDIMPTLLYLLGIYDDNYANNTMGNNLFSNHPGSVLLPNSEIIGQPHDKEHLSSSQRIADLIIKGDYFNLK